MIDPGIVHTSIPVAKLFKACGRIVLPTYGPVWTAPTVDIHRGFAAAVFWSMVVLPWGQFELFVAGWALTPVQVLHPELVEVTDAPGAGVVLLVRLAVELSVDEKLFVHPLYIGGVAVGGSIELVDVALLNLNLVAHLDVVRPSDKRIVEHKRQAPQALKAITLGSVERDTLMLPSLVVISFVLLLLLLSCR